MSTTAVAIHHRHILLVRALYANCRLQQSTFPTKEKKSWSQKRTGVQADSKPRLVFTAEVSSRIRVENHTGIDQKDIQHGIGRIPAIIVWIDGL
ncbi:hypothetical protein RRG08_011712 [Elysia crispata]|uniref:Uncharacterized protein n=1 Tax=Elysia crispata TaxID=231223 RepID=A0AAE0ZET8_9GAST|nr:hypothetical protein RRG08_011712 [Elysia crispata]